MLNLQSKVRQRLLRYYFTNPAAHLHVRDLAQRLDVDPSNLSKELRHLENEGLFSSEISGRQKYFRLNRKYPLLAEVHRIVEKTIGTTPLLAEALGRIDGIQEAYLYGSFARNQQDVASDIDVIVIGNPKGDLLAEAIRALERQLGREINYTVLSRKEKEAEHREQLDAVTALALDRESDAPDRPADAPIRPHPFLRGFSKAFSKTRRGIGKSAFKSSGTRCESISARARSSSCLRQRISRSLRARFSAASCVGAPPLTTPK